MRIRQQLGWIVLLVALSPVSGAAESPACDPWAAKIASVQGNVEARRGDNADWQSVTLNEIYCPGDQIRVGDKSRAGIILANETLVRLDENSAIKLATIEKDEFSLLELLKGIAHFISRVPRSLKVNTPFVNAAIEGTEFVVAIANQQTTVTVFEGTVLTQNDQGELRITNGESAVATSDTAPSKVLLAKPRDAVQWALYFPPVIDSEDGKLAEAARLLNVGRVNEAQGLLATLDSAEAKALLSVIAVVNNDRDKAFALASESVQQAPQSATAHIALSYAWQAKLDLQMALASATEATRQAPNNAIAWARLAELQLSVGELDDALDSAQQATQLNGQLSRTQSILGYAYLVRIDIDEAKAAFEKAILLDQTDPLPRLGLGLAKIRRNELAQGRRDIEIAAMLDPNNAIIRSYLGKAYFEEKRAPLDAEQFAMAKELDPNDPTPYYYDAIRKQTENNPVGALEDINKSIVLNDNRAVYRSSLQLDQDEAARNATSSRIYQDLGYEQLAINNASRSLALDPSNYSAHALLADSYLYKPRHEIARISEVLQGKLLNPLNSNPQQPQLNQGSLTLLNNLGANNTSQNEYNKLFQRNGINLGLSGLAAGNSTEGSELIFSGTYDNFTFSAGNYDYKTDGFHDNNGLDQTLENIFAQLKLTHNFSIFYEKNEKNEIAGDDYRFYADNYFPDVTTDDKEKNDRIGFRLKFNPRNILVGTYLDQKKIFTRTQSFGIFGNLFDTSNDESEMTALRYLYSGDIFSFTLGYSDTDIKGTVSSFFNDIPLIPPTQSDVRDSSEYLYTYFYPMNSMELTLGVAHDTYEGGGFDLEKTLPKFGANWLLNQHFNLRFAYFETLRKSNTSDTTLEPTMVAGFNQFYDDEIGSHADSLSFAVDFIQSNNLTIGIDHVKRDLKVPITPSVLDMNEETTTAYIYWIPDNNITLSLKAQREELVRGTFPGNPTFENVLTYRFPLGLDIYIGNNVKTNFVFTYVEQEGSFVDVNSGVGIPGKDNFWNIDFNTNFLLPNRAGSIMLGFKNLFNKDFNYEETDKNKPQFAPERLSYIRFNLFL